MSADAIRKAATAGRIPADCRHADGSYRLEAAVAAFEGNRKARPGPGRPPAPPKEGGTPTLFELQAEHERVKIRERELKVAQREGELVEWRPFRRAMFDLVRRERDAWITWPASVASRLASEFGLDLGPVQIALEREVRAKLRDMARRMPLEAGAVLPCTYCGAVPCQCRSADG